MAGSVKSGSVKSKNLRQWILVIGILLAGSFFIGRFLGPDEHVGKSYLVSREAVPTVEGTTPGELQIPPSLPSDSSMKTEKGISHGFIVIFQDEPVALHKKAAREKSLTDAKVEDDAEEYRKSLKKHQDDALVLASKKTGVDLKGRVKGRVDYVLNAALLDIDSWEALELARTPGVARVEENRIVRAFLNAAGPLVRADDVWDAGVDGSGITVAIIDTGINYDHVDLGGCFGTGCKVEKGYDFFNNDNDPMDDNGHGTHCAGIVASTDGNHQGLKGIAPGATIYAYKVLDSQGYGYMYLIIQAIDRAVQDGADIISMSLGGSGNPDDASSSAVNNAVALGTVVVVAAGNSGPQGNSYCRSPGSNGQVNSICSPGVALDAITVGATMKQTYAQTLWGDTTPSVDEVTGFSSRGPVLGETGEYGLAKPDIVAPGAIICSARYASTYFPLGEHILYYPCVDDEHVQLAGTSMAAPIVAGITALVKQNHPDWSPREIKMALRNTAKDLYPVFSHDLPVQGFGRVDALSAVQASRPPVAFLNSSGKIISSLVPIRGYATGTAPISYAITHSPAFTYGVHGLSWTAICMGSQQIQGDTLCTWDTSDLADGTYAVKLSVTNNGIESTDYAFFRKNNTEILHPRDLFLADSLASIYPEVQGKTITVEGTSAGNHFHHYTIAWTPHYWNNWSASRVTLAGEGTVPVVNGFLGEINTSSWQTGFYDIRLTTHENGGVMRIHAILAYVDASLQEGWPRQIYDIHEMNAPYSHAQPVVADINGDADLEIITTPWNLVDVRDPDGTEVPGWPVSTLDSSYFSEGPAIGDVNGDHKADLVLQTSTGMMYVLKNDGTFLIPPFPMGGFAPTLFDLNKDGILEIVMNGYDHHLHVLDARNGQDIAGFPVYSQGVSKIAIADLDNDGSPELAFKTSQGSSYHLTVLQPNGTVMPGWPVDLPSGNPTAGSPIIGDIDYDGTLDILLLSKPYLFVWNMSGTALPGWPVNLGDTFHPHSEISIGDMDNDGWPDIVAAGPGECLYALDYQGRIKPQFPLCYNVSKHIYVGFDGHPIIGNAEQSAGAEITSAVPFAMFSNYDFIRYPIALPSGSTTYKYIDSPITAEAVPQADIDHDGLTEIIILTYQGLLYVYETGTPASNYGWPLYMHDERRTGNFHAWCKPGLYAGSCYPGANPLYCDALQRIVPKCSRCGCPRGTQCDTYKEICITPPSRPAKPGKNVAAG